MSDGYWGKVTMHPARLWEDDPDNPKPVCDRCADNHHYYCRDIIQPEGFGLMMCGCRSAFHGRAAI